MSPIGIQNVCICALLGEVIRLGPKLLVWHHCQHVFAIPWTRQSRPSPFCLVLNTFSAVTTNACCRFRQARTTLTTADGKVAKSARCCSTGDFTLFCHVFDSRIGSFILPLCHFRVLSCSRVCLLDVSRLLGLTLRHSAPVCSCHGDSLTRWRLAFAQEAARVVSSASF